MKPIPIVKMSGAGNDFVVLGPEAAGRVDEAWVRRVCRRGLSVGADGVLFVEPSKPGEVRLRFMNPDGSRAFCGNGTRCAARYAFRRGFGGPELTLDTEVGPVPARVRDDAVELDLPAPRDRGEVAVNAGDERLVGHWVDAGSPHFVCFVADVADAPLERWAPPVRRDPAFGDAGVNVNLVQEVGPGHLALRTWERGVEGETLACGSGAVAVGFVAARRRGVRSVRLLPASGVPLRVDLRGTGDELDGVTLSGDARWIFEAELGPEATWGF